MSGDEHGENDAVNRMNQFQTCPQNVIAATRLFNGSHVYEDEDSFDINKNSTDIFCPMVFDSYLCWPRTKAGEKVWQKCPEGVRGLDNEKSLYRQCLLDGSWFSCPSLQDDITTGTGNENKVGWTNYSLCWTASTQKIMEDLNQKAGCPDEASEEAKEIKIFVAQLCRVLEMVGYSLSLIVLIFAFATFCYFRKLRKPRVTRIHMNLFASMILQCLVRLVIYVDQMIVRQQSSSKSEDLADQSQNSTQSSDEVWGIDNTPLLCEVFYTLIEYGKTTMFLWMFIEGIILYHMTTVAYSRGPEHQTLFYLCGWLFPIPLTCAWVITKSYEAKADPTHCEIGYTFLDSYWILEGPRIAAIMLNILILLNVMRVLFTHLSGECESDTNQIKKSLKSLFFLLPLLGITNILHFLWPNPLRGSWQSFAIWSFISHFLYSFQGLFVASVYFLFDDKVKDTLYKFWVLNFRLRDWGRDRSDNNSRSSKHGLHSCRIFEPKLNEDFRDSGGGGGGGDTILPLRELSAQQSTPPMSPRHFSSATTTTVMSNGGNGNHSTRNSLVPPSSGLCSKQGSLYSKQGSTKKSHLRKVRLPSDSSKNSSFGFSMRSKEKKSKNLINKPDDVLIQVQVEPLDGSDDIQTLQKEENNINVENVAKINNENSSSGSAKVTIMVNYEAQSNSSQSHAFRKNHPAERNLL